MKGLILGEAPVGGGFSMAGYWVWGSSVIRGDDLKYHMFATRWPSYLPFHPGWMIGSEIVHAISDTPEGPYRYVDVALGARGAEFFDGRSVHNPKIVKYKDTYVLYYMGSTHPFEEVTDTNADQVTVESKWCIAARWRKRIGMATSQSLDGPWERKNVPALDVKPGTFYSYLTSNPSPLIREDGSVILVFKGRGYLEDGITHGPMVIGLSTAPTCEGPYTVIGNGALFSPEELALKKIGINDGLIEDPHLWRDDDGYHMVAKDHQGIITGSLHGGLLAHSENGLEWHLDKNPLAYTREVQWDDGKTLVQGQLERPFVFVQDGRPTHIFFATMDGPGGFENGTKSWNMVIPLQTQ